MGGLLLAQGGLESDSRVMEVSATGSEGKCLVEGLGREGSILDSVGGQELTLRQAGESVEMSLTGAGGGVNDGGHLSCIDGVTGSAKMARASSREGWGDSGGML